MAASALLVAAASEAQSGPVAAPWHPEWGDWSISLALPAGGGPGFGIWRQAGLRTALGLTAEGALLLGRDGDDGAGEERRELHVAAGPALRVYAWSGSAPVAPFFTARAAATYGVVGVAGEPTRSRYGALLGIGLGAEWFPVRGVGVGGHTGVEASFSRFDQAGAQALDAIRARLFTSALTLQLYF